MQAPELEQIRAAMMGGHDGSDVDHARGVCSLALRMAARVGAKPEIIASAAPGPFASPTAPGLVVLEQSRAAWPAAGDGKPRTLAQCWAQTAASVDAVLALPEPAPGNTPAPAGPAFATVAWRSDFSAGWDGWTSTPWNDEGGAKRPTIIDSPLPGLGKCARFALAGGQKRTESQPTAAQSLREDDELLVAWTDYLEPGFPVDVASDSWGGSVVLQLKNDGTGTPPLEVKIGHGQYFLDGNSGAFHYDIGPALTGKRIDLAIHVRMSADAGEAVMDAWYNGVQTVRGAHPRGAGTLYAGKGSYLKTGIYRNPAIGATGVRLLDNLVIGTPGKADGPAPTPAPGPAPAPAEPTQPYRSTSELPYGSFPIPGGWIATQGCWGDHAPQAIETVGARGFRVTRADHDKNGVAAYPSVYSGAAWASGAGKGWKSTRVRDLSTLETSARFAAPASSWRGNMAYDLWFDRDPAKHDGLEMMIWAWTQGVAPAGSKVAAIDGDGAGWDVWRGTVGGTAVLSYVRRQNTLALDRLGLKAFLDDAVTRGLLGPDWYLTSPQIGAELWRGGAGFALLDWSFAVAS